MAQLKEGTTIGGVDILHILDLLDIELGRNENGNWIRWNNGLQVCWIFVRNWPGSLPDSIQGNIYRSSENLLWTYPKPFYDEPVISGTCTGNAWIGDTSIASRDNRTSFLFRVFRTPAATADPTIRLKAVGWWKEPDIEGYEPVE